VVHGIIKDHGGVILVQSMVDVGTWFEVFLPAQVGEGQEADSKPEAAPMGHGQHILLVDDEASVCNVMKTLLTRNGYRVTSFCDPIKAIHVFEANPASYDLLITDLSMPGINGVQFSERVHRLRHELPIVLATGFGGDWLLGVNASAGICKVVHKPITSVLIYQVLREIFQAR
jgi:DNA-binding NtrC family response regulator